MKRFHIMPMGLASLALVSCQGNDFQSALHPASGPAREIAWLWWLMVAVYGAVFAGTLGLAAWAIFKRGKQDGQPPGGSMRFVVIAGIVVPSVILIAMLVQSLRTNSSVSAPETAFTIELTGYRWWWDVRYADQEIDSANEIRIPVGVPVAIELLSADVIHSFWVPNLHGKMDMMPDHMNRFWLRADRPGIFRGVCAEFCGQQHALMGIDVIAMPREEFDAWVASRQVPPDIPDVSRGRDIFFNSGCAACHTIGGTAAIANLGPDLTWLAERRTLAASTLPNTPENLGLWIANPQWVKPGNLMPPTDLAPAELGALVEFLQTLR